MLKEKKLLVIILMAIGAILTYTWANIIFTDNAASWRHYMAILLFFPLIYLSIYQLKKAVLFTGLYLILGTCNLLTLTPAITSNAYGIKIGSVEISTPTFQLYSFLLFVLFFLVNFNTLVEYYLDYQDAKKLKSKQIESDDKNKIVSYSAIGVPKQEKQFNDLNSKKTSSPNMSSENKDIMEPEEFRRLSGEGLIIDGTDGGLVIGPSHEEGGVLLLSSFGSYFKIIGKIEGYEYIFNIATAAVTIKFFPELNNFKRDFNPPFRPFAPEKHHRIIDARLEGSKIYPSKFIFIENRMSQAIINKYSTSRILEKIDQLNRSFTYTFDDRDFYKTTKVNIIEVVSGNIVQVCNLNRTDLTV